MHTQNCSHETWREEPTQKPRGRFDVDWIRVVITGTLLLLQWHYSPYRALASTFFLKVSKQCLFMGWGCEPHAQPPTWKVRASRFVWPGRPYQQLCYRQPGSRDHLTTRASPLSKVGIPLGRITDMFLANLDLLLLQLPILYGCTHTNNQRINETK